VGHAKAVMDDRLARLLDAGICGVLLSDSAYERPDWVATLTHDIKRRAGREVFVAVDHEGGSRHSERGGGFSRLPNARRLGQTEDVELARHVGHVLGRELRAVGVDMTLGPAIDVASNPDNPALRDRALHADPTLVAALGAALIEGQQSEGVAACVKHFPGHGDTVFDSKVTLPILPHGVSRLEEVELPPFVGAINARCAGMLVGHISFAALDRDHPASLSRPIIFGLLRQKLGYRGFVLIDDIDMGALSREFTRDHVAVSGIASGADCFLCACRPESAFEVIDAIERGVERGDILPERLEAARRRTRSLLHKYYQDAGPHPNLDVVGRQTTFEALDELSKMPPLRVPKIS